MISIVIPTFNEARIIEAAIESLLMQGGGFEIIVADGGSTDGTLELLAESSNVKKIVSQPGRGNQMNAGAGIAEGEILLFLHVDCTLPARALGAIEQVLANPAVSGGSFYLAFDDPRLFFKSLAFFSRINHILCTYGDQGLFLRTATFREIGGFRKIPVMEDVEILKRLRAVGCLAKIPLPIITSARRYRQKCPWLQHLQTSLIVIGYHLGVSPRFLARHYYGGNQKGKPL